MGGEAENTQLQTQTLGWSDSMPAVARTNTFDPLT